MTGVGALEREFALLRAWLFSHALPLWSTVGVDRVQGGFHETLKIDGAPGTAPRRARVTGRQIYAFSVAAKLGWQGSAREMVRHGVRNLFARYLPVEGGMAVSTVSAEVMQARNASHTSRPPKRE